MRILFSLMPIFIFIVFCIIIVRLIQMAAQWKKNNDSPVLTVNATIVAKRANVDRHIHNTGTNMHHSTSSTTYYVTFEVASGDRLVFNVRSTEYGVLAERDTGRLTFQGTRFLGFERTRNGG